jgi:hypothetical protein
VVAGDVNPPPGPVAGTMKTLDEVEPRTPLFQADVPITITEPGSYYLTENLVNLAAESMSVVRIDADNVSLDLNGFTIDANETSLAIFTRGVSVAFGRQHATIRNGHIRRARRGVDADGASNIRIESLQIGPAASGVGIGPGDSCVVSDCLITGGGGGVDVQSANNVVLRNVTVVGTTGTAFRSNFGIDVVFERCEAIDCATGFDMITGAADVAVIECRASSCAIGFRDVVGGAIGFVKNIAVNCATPFSGIPNTSSNAATAEPWDNVSF